MVSSIPLSRSGMLFQFSATRHLILFAGSELGSGGKSVSVTICLTFSSVCWSFSSRNMNPLRVVTNS